MLNKTVKNNKESMYNDVLRRLFLCYNRKQINLVIFYFIMGILYGM